MRAAAKRAALRAASLLTLCTAGAGCETAGGMAIRGPRRQARIWVVIQALRTGNFSVTGHTVRYTQGGRSYDETITVGYRGSVSAAAAYIPPEPDELRCLKASGARLLPDLR
jgi:hypothetical protein